MVLFAFQRHVGSGTKVIFNLLLLGKGNPEQAMGRSLMIRQVIMDDDMVKWF